MAAASRAHQFIVGRRRPDFAGHADVTDADAYRLWRFDPDADELLSPMPLAPGARLDRRHQLIQVGNFLLEWGPVALESYAPAFPYRLFRFDATSTDPLGMPAERNDDATPCAATVATGSWPKTKFWQYRADFGNPNGAHEGWEAFKSLLLLPVGGWVLQILPTSGRGTFGLWNFDPMPVSGTLYDPLPKLYQPLGSFDGIEAGHTLIPLGNYVLDWIPASGEYRLLSFDPQNPIPLALPPVRQGRFDDIDGTHRLVPMGELVLDWTPGDRSYRLWRVDPKAANPLCGPLRTGTLPDGLDDTFILTGILPCLPPPSADEVTAPGTMAFMRAKIKHIVYLLLENRSFDHACGWLYEGVDAKELNFVGHEGPFDGASTAMFNVDPTLPEGERKVYLSKYNDGKPVVNKPLEFLQCDPYHDTSDVLRQCFYGGNGYAARATPTMNGFVWNNGVHDVMVTYTPNQLPVLSGLAQHFAVSDAWFCSTPGPTDPNRAFAFTGSSLGELNNFQNDNIYKYWPAFARRQSLWKVLWSHGVTDWSMYYSVEWENFVHTYQLFMKGQVPSVDQQVHQYIKRIDRFMEDARQGTLPAFSYLEPAWIATHGTSSYHPGADPGAGEKALADIYTALRNGPSWNETLFIVTFDEHGGLFDHVAPPYVDKPWPHDRNDGFEYDMLGPRVPAIVVSPWIRQQTVFRSGTRRPFDHTSIIATLLHWFGVPRASWALGDRVHHAPTFETVLARSTPRDDAPASLALPRHAGAPCDGRCATPSPASALDVQMARQILWHMVGSRLPLHEARQLIERILANATDAPSLHAAIRSVAADFKPRPSPPEFT